DFLQGQSNPVAITESQQIQNAVQTQCGNCLFGRFFHQRFGAESYTQTGNRQHRQVVGTITYSNGLLQTDTFAFSQFTQQIGFALPIHNRQLYFASHHTVFDWQAVGVDVIDAQTFLQFFGKVGKTAGKDRSFVTQTAQLADQVFCTFSQT